jgi:hypothetical protein
VWVSWYSMTMSKYRGGLEFCDIEISSLSLLARQVWRILLEPNTLSANILKVVYFLDIDILSSAMGQKSSHILAFLV